MKRILFTMLCCTMLMMGFTACGAEKESNTESVVAEVVVGEQPGEGAEETEAAVSEQPSEETEESEAATSEQPSEGTEETEAAVSEQFGVEIAESEATKSEQVVEESTVVEQIVYTVELTGVGENKVEVIKAYNKITGLGLKEAKDTIDAAPCVVLENADEETANLMKASLEECGATVTLYSETIETQINSSEEAQAQTYYVKLIDYGESKEDVISAYRELTGLGLKEAKDAVDAAPCILLETNDIDAAESMKVALEEAGAIVDEDILSAEISEENVSESTDATEVTESIETTGSTETANTEETAASEEMAEQVAIAGKFAVEKVFYITDAGTVLTGKVEQGSISLGDSAVIILADGSEIAVTINRIEIFGGFLEIAEEGDDVGIGFEEDIAKEAVSTAVSIVVKAD